MVRPFKGCRKCGRGDLDILEGKVYNGFVSDVRLVKGIEHWKRKRDRDRRQPGTAPKQRER
jgi:hypothetical protein